jgi:twinkle protein
MSEIQQIKEKVGQAAKDIIIQHLSLEKIGTKYRCPDRLAHRNGDRNPSLAWDENLLQFKCFGCGKLIDIYSLYRDYLNYSHSEIVREFLDKDHDQTNMAKNRARFQDAAKQLSPLTDIQIDYLKTRHLNEETIKAFQLKNYQGSITFPYYKNGILTGCKTRKPEKHTEGPKYLSLPGSKPGLYGFDNTDPEKPLVICEGEIDCMIIYQAGFQNVVSVGAGANSLKELIEQNKTFLDSFDSLLIFSDNDEAGAGMDTAFLDAYPDKTKLIDKSIMAYKDANQEYSKGGAAAIRRIIESAQEKIEGLFNPDNDEVSLEEVFARGKFISTGLPSIDMAINDLAPGCVTLVVGRSNGGKSTFINQVVANAIESNNKVFLISGEDDKRILVNKVYQSVIGRDTKLYDYVRINKRNFKVPKQSVLKHLKEWHKDKLHLFMKGESNLKTTNQLFDLISRKIKQDHYNLLVIDNLMSVLSVTAASEKYEAQADFTQRCCDIAKLYHCHIIIVLHPNKTFRKDGSLDFEQISGSADIGNKADNILAIIREYDDETKLAGIDGYCEVLKNRYFPDLKKIPLHFDKETGLLLELDMATGRGLSYRFDIMRKEKIQEGFQELMPWEEES